MDTTKDHHILYTLQVTRAVQSYLVWQGELAKSRNADPKRLLRYGYKIYSQNDEDGIIQEIFKRIGIDTATFIEFGVGVGIECNTAKLLVDSWKGLWIEANHDAVTLINRNILPSYGNLTVKEAKVTAENINDLIGGYVTGQVDLLSIDIDFNDYWIWKAINVIKPRVVVIEYNSALRPPLSLAVRYYADAGWDMTKYFCAFLLAVVRLWRGKRYKIGRC